MMRKYKLTVESKDKLPWFIEIFQRQRRRWILVNNDPKDDTILAASRNRKDIETYLGEIDQWDAPYPWHIKEWFVYRPIPSRVIRWWFFSNISERRRKRIDRKWMRNWEKQDEAIAKETSKIINELKQQPGYEHVVNYYPEIEDQDEWEDE